MADNIYDCSLRTKRNLAKQNRLDPHADATHSVETTATFFLEISNNFVAKNTDIVLVSPINSYPGCARVFTQDFS